MDIKVEVIDKNQLCPACLCIGRTLHSITDDKLKSYYLNVLNEIPLCNVPTKCPSICWECAALLRGGVAFREQVKDSCRILQTYTNEKLTECLLTEVARPPRLRTHRLETLSIIDSALVEVEAPLDRLTNGLIEVEVPSVDRLGERPETRAVFVKDERQRDWDCEVKPEQPPSEDDRSCASDCSDDIARLEAEVETIVRDTPLPEREKSLPEGDRSKKKKGRRKADKVKKTKKLDKSLDKEKKPQPKILTIDLSYEEMQQERKQEAAREVFTRAPWRCLSCLLPFAHEDSYTQHVAARHRPELGKYTCPVCQTVIASVESFTAHYKRHLRRYVCGACGRRGADRKAMLNHHERAHEAARTRHTCKECGATANSAESLRYHRASHAARAQCPDCDKTFSHRAGLMNHRVAVHKLNNAFPCPVCQKVFRWKTSLKKHMEIHDRKQGAAAPAAARCVPCDVHFASVCSYRRHLRNSLRHVTPDHHKFICDHCSRRFANKTKLRDHIEEKHLHKTYQCHICLKPSKNRVCLDQHVRNVHKGRPNDKMCHHCGKGFPTKVQLESHIRSHTGERPFICEFCPTTFSQQSNLYKHYRQIHLNIKSKRYAIGGKQSKAGSRTGVPATAAPPANPATVVLSFNQEKQFVVQYDGVSNVTIV